MIKFALTSDKFCNLCIENDWYTRGTCAEYIKMIDYVDSHCKEMCDIDVQDKIEYVAANVLYHSNIESMCKMSCCTVKEVQESIEFALLNSCMLSFER